MPGIVIFGGTTEGRLLAEAFRNTELDIHICVATDYGAALLPAGDNITVHAGRMEETEMEAFLKGLGAAYCLDATHPYAAAVTENLYRACRNQKVAYIRVCREDDKSRLECQSGEREERKRQQTAGGRVISVRSVAEAAAFLNTVEGNVLITTGSKELDCYTAVSDYKNRCFVRILPALEAMEKCRELGFSGRNLIAVQGPFEEEFNYALLKQIQAAWMVTKASGKEGGFPEKCEAALRAGCDILVVERPAETISEGPEQMEMSLSETVGFLEQRFCLSHKRTLYLVGMGPGDHKLLTKEAEACLEACDVLIGARRILQIWPKGSEKPFLESYQKEQILSFLQAHREYRIAAVVYSGDMGFYSGARGLRELLEEQGLLEEYEICPVPGIASPIYFLDKIGVAWDTVLFVSCHGQQVDLVSLIRSHHRICVLLGKKEDVALICRVLLEGHLEYVKMTVGERLSYEDERIVHGSPAELREREFDSLSVLFLENPKPAPDRIGPGIPDSLFLRGKVPMTKQEIRILSLAKLQLTKDAILYDVGAGTGSVALEAALQCRQGSVFAIERKPEAVELIRANRERFGAKNMEILEGEAPACLEGLPAPTHVFVGGSGGKLSEIIDAVRSKNPKVRFVVNAVTLETLAQLVKIREKFPEYKDMEAIQVNVAKNRALGSYQLMTAENPVTIVSFGGGDADV